MASKNHPTDFHVHVDATQTGSDITNQMLRVNSAQKVRAVRQSDPALREERLPANDKPTVAILL